MLDSSWAHRQAVSSTNGHSMADLGAGLKGSIKRTLDVGNCTYVKTVATQPVQRSQCKHTW